MSQTKVRSDKHGLYIKAGGYIFRPQVTERYFPSYNDAAPILHSGDTVNARHLAGTGLAKLKFHKLELNWFSHGSYLQNTVLESESLFTAVKT